MRTLHSDSSQEPFTLAWLRTISRMSGPWSKQLDQVVFVLIEETRRPLRKAAVGTDLRRRHHRPPTLSLEVVKRHIVRFNQSTPNRYSNSVHEVIAVRLRNNLDASQRSADGKLSQPGLTSGVQMGLGILESDTASPSGASKASKTGSV